MCLNIYIYYVKGTLQYYCGEHSSAAASPGWIVIKPFISYTFSVLSRHTMVYAYVIQNLYKYQYRLTNLKRALGTKSEVQCTLIRLIRGKVMPRTVFTVELRIPKCFDCLVLLAQNWGVDIHFPVPNANIPFNLIWSRNYIKVVHFTYLYYHYVYFYLFIYLNGFGRFFGSLCYQN